MANPHHEANFTLPGKHFYVSHIHLARSNGAFETLFQSFSAASKHPGPLHRGTNKTLTGITESGLLADY